MSAIAERLQSVRAQVAAAAERVGRAPDGVRLVAVSKNHSVEAVAEAAAAGQVLFGENRVQEAAGKVSALPDHLDWHLIGHLQMNKVRKALPLFRMIESVDSAELAHAIDRIAEELGLIVPVLLQVNAAEDPAKYGFTAESVRETLPGLLRLPRLQIRGLMTIPAFTEDAEGARPAFSRLRELRDALEHEQGIRLPELSMGMSHDFPVAIAEGATLVRVGTAIFGEREKA
ncbi:MAG: YggS family pyridoxal phosphate-dependent enzyme [Verrucomicrobiales bacterium]